ncbi:outer membrane protein P1 [Neisseria meningitidis]|nr:outer membrane protein P1 [Neisseria meningitidis]
MGNAYKFADAFVVAAYPRQQVAHHIVYQPLHGGKDDSGFLFGFVCLSVNHDLGRYSGLNLNQYSVASPCRTICTVCGFVALS